jgi:peptidoglycan/LPS O-acetylase OafA/YrhL
MAALRNSELRKPNGKRKTTTSTMLGSADFGKVLMRPERSPNNFGGLRLLFAVLVVVSHAPELIDGDRSREILTRIFGTLSFGEVGVYGFFLISGYLITKSFEDSRSVKSYVLKRVLRIYPGYIAAYLLCVFALGPFVGGHISELSGARVMMEMIGLKAPGMEGVFPGSHYPALNGPMWTISYEFRCYLLVIAAGFLGLLANRRILLGLTAATLVLSAMHLDIVLPFGLRAVVGEPGKLIMFAGIFACGALHYLYRDRIRYEWQWAAFCVVALVVLMFYSLLAEAALATLGGYVLFWFAFNVRSKNLGAIGRNVDLSYGIYLYAWPVQKLLIWFDPEVSPWSCLETTAIATALALASWTLIEKPFLNLKTTHASLVTRATVGDGDVVRGRDTAP